MAKAPAKPVKKPITKTRRNVGIALIVAALLLFIAGGWLTYSYFRTKADLAAARQAALSQKVDVPTQSSDLSDAATGTPVKIDIPSVGVSQPVNKGDYNAETGEWTLSYQAVYWATMTSPANSKTGNTFIYGHDVKEIFGPLLDAQVGAKAIVRTDNDYVFTYTLKKSTQVDPTDVSLIQPTAKPTLTVQTCSGSWYQYRQIFTFELDGYVRTKPFK